MQTWEAAVGSVCEDCGFSWTVGNMSGHTLYYNKRFEFNEIPEIHVPDGCLLIVQGDEEI
jgi:hypothetical protein